MEDTPTKKTQNIAITMCVIKLAKIKKFVNIINEQKCILKTEHSNIYCTT